MNTPVELSSFAETIFKRTYAITTDETWEGCASRVSKAISNDVDLEEKFFKVISERKFIPGGRYLAQAGKEVSQYNNCFLYRAEDSREGWGNLINMHMQALSTGGGGGTYYGDIRPKGTPIKRFGGVASGPISLMCMVNEVARHVMAGGKRRSALWAGLPWDHLDIEQFITAKTWPTQIRALKELDFNFPATLDMTNISVCLNDDFFKVVNEDAGVYDLYYRICKMMCKTGEPGFSVNLGDKSNEVLRNPCCEVVSDTDGDVCNLGSVNLAKISNLEEFEEVIRIAMEFLYLGTFKSWLPNKKNYEVREQNRRVGLGLMGLHEWCVRNGTKYEPSQKLGEWLNLWRNVSEECADKLSFKYSSVRPVGVRAIAPTGTIGIIGETTTGIEPVFCSAYKRRFLDQDQKWKFSYVIDPTVEKLVQELSINPSDIEDAYSLSTDVERRISMQAFIQDYVDQAISSTINLPEWGEYGNNNAKKFAETLLKYLPRLRGITVYPEGARDGQPITPIKYETAKKHKGVIYEESSDRCSNGVCGV